MAHLTVRRVSALDTLENAKLRGESPAKIEAIETLIRGQVLSGKAKERMRQKSALLHLPQGPLTPLKDEELAKHERELEEYNRLRKSLKLQPTKPKFSF